VSGQEQEVTKVSHVTGKWTAKQPAIQLHFQSALEPVVSSTKIFFTQPDSQSLAVANISPHKVAQCNLALTLIF